MKPINTRVCIYPKDVMLITGWTYKHSRLVLNNLKKKLNKQQHHFISIEEFCQDRGLEVEHVRNSIL